MNETEFRAKMGQLMRAAREDLGMSMNQFGEHADIHPKTVSGAESGKHWPQGPNQAKIEGALGWTRGIMGQLFDMRETVDPDTLTVAAMQAGTPDAAPDQEGMIDVQDLTVDELFEEVTLLQVELRRRFRDAGLAGNPGTVTPLVRGKLPESDAIMTPRTHLRVARSRFKRTETRYGG